jgi:hypothetical protein
MLKNGCFVMPLVVVLLSGCTKRPPDGSLRAVGDALVAAMNRHDLRGYLAVLPTESQVEAHLDCQGQTPVASILRRVREEAPATLDIWRETGLRTVISAFDEGAAEELVVSPGDVVRDCVVKRGFEIRRIPVVIAMTRAGRTEETREIWPFWRFSDADRWYYTRF